VDYDVCASDEALYGLEVPRSLEIGRETALVSIDRMEQGAVVVERLVGDIELPAKVAADRSLDFDDVGAEIGEAHRARRPGEKLREIQYDDASQKLVGLSEGVRRLRRSHVTGHRVAILPYVYMRKHN
jgi:hypothetical protein